MSELLTMNSFWSKKNGPPVGRSEVIMMAKPITIISGTHTTANLPKRRCSARLPQVMKLFWARYIATQLKNTKAWIW